MEEGDIPSQLDHVRFMPVSRFHQLRGWARQTFFERQAEIEEEEEEDRIEEEMRRAAKQGKRVVTHPEKHSKKVQSSHKAVPKPASRPAAAQAEHAAPAPPRSTRPGSIGYKNETWQTRLSEKERRLLGIWIAWHCPDGKGRTSINLFKAMTASYVFPHTANCSQKHDFQDPGWTKLARGRSAGAWRDWYRKFYKMPFPDGRSFGDRIEQWVEEVEGWDLEGALGDYEEAGNSQDGAAPRKRRADSPERPPQRRRKIERAEEKDYAPKSRSEKTPARRMSTRQTATPETRARDATGTPKRRRQLVVEIPMRRSLSRRPA